MTPCRPVRWFKVDRARSHSTSKLARSAGDLPVRWKILSAVGVVAVVAVAVGLLGISSLGAVNQATTEPSLWR